MSGRTRIGVRVVISLCVVLVASCATVTHVDEATIEYKTKTIASIGDTIKIDVEFPRFSPMSRTTIAINARVGRVVGDFVRGSMGQARKDHRLESKVGETGYLLRQYESVGRYLMTRNDARYASFYLDLYNFTGGAHGSTVRHGFVFDARSGRRLGLSDFYGAVQNARDDFGTIIAAEASKAPREYFDMDDSERVNYIDEYDFYLIDDSIVIFFQQYEISPYAYGFREYRERIDAIE